MAQYSFSNAPQEVTSAVARLVGLLRESFGTKLIGVYLHGSLAMGGFQPDRSDIDVLAVTKESADMDVKLALAERLLALSGHPFAVELHICTQKQLQPWRHPCPFDFHYSEGWRGAIAGGLSEGTADSLLVLNGGEDVDLAAHLTVLRERGLSLWGEPIAGVVPAVPAEDYLDAVLADVNVELRDVSKQPVYYVLNMLRVVKAVTDGTVLSKEEAGVWGLTAMPFHIEVIYMALEFYRRPERNEALHFDIGPLRLFLASCRMRTKTRNGSP
ncbi:aminoglycoside adenylyltransferase domain-containing protein [Paenibacillus thermotolerans]|uniref:aminoglycoside adenylyltransferase domain-containing protein n=1 Tax=Paenibacillus thermotolerans TaxID=3027807 RepID=UPI002367F9E0|nr:MULTISPECIES: aminoglycoside adenylyltransferase domain-containing protein [unclassified Paenibacillus]